jgi:DNA-binding PadR family transcriptional regulator
MKIEINNGDVFDKEKSEAITKEGQKVVRELQSIIQETFIEGAKFEQQRMYSEEEVKFIISEALQSALVNVDLEQWFKQFNKKK